MIRLDDNSNVINKRGDKILHIVCLRYNSDVSFCQSVTLWAI